MTNTSPGPGLGVGRATSRNCSGPPGAAISIARITSEPARVAGLAAGTLSVGAVADVVVFDPEAHWTVEAAALASQGKHTPFLGYNLAGQVRTTIVAGHVAFQRS